MRGWASAAAAARGGAIRGATREEARPARYSRRECGALAEQGASRQVHGREEPQRLAPGAREEPATPRRRERRARRQDRLRRAAQREASRPAPAPRVPRHRASARTRPGRSSCRRTPAHATTAQASARAERSSRPTRAFPLEGRPLFSRALPPTPLPPLRRAASTAGVADLPSRPPARGRDRPSARARASCRARSVRETRRPDGPSRRSHSPGSSACHR